MFFICKYEWIFDVNKDVIRSDVTVQSYNYRIQSRIKVTGKFSYNVD